MFNALKYNEVLRKAGWNKDQATGLLEVVSDMADQNFATKKDLDLSSTQIRAEMSLMRSDLSQEITKVRTELKHEIQEVRTELKQEIQEVRTEISRLDNKIDSMGDKIVIRLGTLIVGVATIMSLIQQNH
jgi:hypothetical protein